jgi:hypothetical protein
MSTEWPDTINLPPEIADAEIISLLRRVASGELVPRLASPKETWEEVYAGNVEYIVDSWKIVVFNDCDSWDYINSVTAPDGRTWAYSHWWRTIEDDTAKAPDESLYAEDANLWDKMVDAFIEAR